MFPLNCSLDELDAFIKKSRLHRRMDVSIGETIKEYEKDNNLKGAQMIKWLQYFRENSLMK